MNKKGFTLIELLAVIIILGILMIIAIPSVTRYISDSRKNAYVDTAKEIVGGARNLVNEGKLEMYDTDVTYYIESSCIKTENASKSPYGDFTKAYVVVTYDGKGYTYYWTSNDDSGQGIKNVVRVDKLDVDNVESDLKDSEISTLRGIDGRSKTVVVSKANNCQKEGANNATEQISGEIGYNPITYPEGKDKSTVVTGDIVKIANEEFYVIKKTSSNLTLLARYNLKVGDIYQNISTKIGEYSSSTPGYGRQSSEALGHDSYNTSYGSVLFSNSNYWSGQVGSNLKYQGKYCTSDLSTGCAYIYDSNSILYSYVESYKSYLNNLGANIVEARILSLEEAHTLESSGYTSILYNTSFWLATPYDNEKNWRVGSDGHIIIGPYLYPGYYGVRPIIVI